MPDKSPRATYPSAHLLSIDKSVLEEEPRDRLFTKALHCCGLTGCARQNKALVTTPRYKCRTLKAIPGTSTSLGKPNDMISRMALTRSAAHLLGCGFSSLIAGQRNRPRRWHGRKIHVPKISCYRTILTKALPYCGWQAAHGRARHSSPPCGRNAAPSMRQGLT